MKKVLFVSTDDFYNNFKNLFDPNPSPDNLVHGFHLAADNLRMMGYTINTFSKYSLHEKFDVVVFNELPFNLDDVEKILSKTRASRAVAIMMETPVVRPNYDVAKGYLNIFDTILSWNEKLSYYHQDVRDLKFSVNFDGIFSTAARPRQVNCIAANKRFIHPNALYDTRFEYIKKFERSPEISFDLFGRNWDQYRVATRGLGRAWNFMARYVPLSKARPSWRGEINSKEQVISNYDFGLCVENAMGYEGYVTEKALQSLNRGAIPLYLGCSSLAKFIPREFIFDLSRTLNFSEVIEYIKSRDVDDLVSTRRQLRAFINSGGLSSFSSARNAQVVVDAIV